MYKNEIYAYLSSFTHQDYLCNKFTHYRHYLMSNAFKKWSKSEDDDLIDSYVNEELELPTIVEIHGRSMLSIAARLVKLNAAYDIESVKGYSSTVPHPLRKIKATGPIITKKEQIECKENVECTTLVIAPFHDNSDDSGDQSHNENDDKNTTEKHKCPNCEEMEHLRVQLQEAMDIIKTLTELL